MIVTGRKTARFLFVGNRGVFPGTRGSETEGYLTSESTFEKHLSLRTEPPAVPKVTE